jgi:hypothetical protein
VDTGKVDVHRDKLRLRHQGGAPELFAIASDDEDNTADVTVL